MKFSVIIPVYNGENYIRASMTSVLEQSYADVRLIVVNDGSTDQTEEVVRSVSSRYSDRDIVYKSVKNGGPAAARNAGIECAEGDYVCFLDADDEYDRRLFEELSAMIGGADVCFWGWKEIKNGKEVFKYTDVFSYPKGDIDGKEAVEGKFYRSLWLCNCNAAYSLKMIKEKGLRYPEGCYSGEDANFIYKCLLNASCVRALQKDYFINRLQEDSLMRSSFSEKCVTELAAVEDLFSYAKQNCSDETLLDIFYSLRLYGKIYVAKRLARSLPFSKIFRFGGLCKKYMPKSRREKGRKNRLPKKKKFELSLYKCKPLFFCFYKVFYSFKKV